jgi:hypothetical protein
MCRKKAQYLLSCFKWHKQEFIPMPYTTEEGGRLNNFAVEPKMYEAQPPTPTQKRNYLIAGAAGLALVAGLIVVAAFIS